MPSGADAGNTTARTLNLDSRACPRTVWNLRSVTSAPARHGMMDAAVMSLGTFHVDRRHRSDGEHRDSAYPHALHGAGLQRG